MRRESGTTKAPNRQLLTATRARGWTQLDLIRELRQAAVAGGVRGAVFSPKTIQRWMQGSSTWPWPEHRQCLEVVFGRSALDLGFIPPWHRADAALDTDDHRAVSWNHQQTVSHLVTAARSDMMDLDRRGFVALTGGMTIAPAIAWHHNAPRTDTEGRGAGIYVDASHVHRIQRRTDDLRLMDDDLGGGDLLALIIADLTYVTAKLATGRYTDTIGRQLHAAAAELARLAGWVCYDTDQHPQAHAYWEAAVRAAHISGDRALGAHVLTNMGNQAYHRANPQTGVTLIQSALDGCKRAATPKVRAILCARLARAHSKNNEPAASRAALEHARRHFARGSHDDDPAWTYYVTPAEIALTAGSCHAELGDHGTAIDEFLRALTAYGVTCPRDRSLVLGRLATAHLARGDLEQALHTGQRALSLVTGSVHSTRSTSHIKELATHLGAHGSQKGTRDFLEQVRST